MYSSNFISWLFAEAVVTCCFGIVPDGSATPVAVFENLEDAMDWGVRKFGDRFAIRHVPPTEASGETRSSSNSN